MRQSRFERKHRLAGDALARMLHGVVVMGLAALLVLGAPQAVAQRFDQGLLWRIEGAGAAPSHLFGTIHLDDARVTALPAPVARALDGAGSFTMEVALDSANLMQLASRMVYLDGRELPAVTGEALFGKLATHTTTLGIPSELARLFKPWAMALLLLMPAQKSADVLDNVLFRIAVERGKPVHQLESVDEQVGAFEGMPEADQVALLRLALEIRERMPRATGQLIGAYLKRDLGAMWRINEETSGDNPEAKRLNAIFTRRLLDERNLRMVERMQPQLKSGNGFVAVGALHLYGERGLLALLQQRGYRVTRVY